MALQYISGLAVLPPFAPVCVKDGKDLLSTAYNPFGEVLPKTPPIRRLNCAFTHLLLALILPVCARLDDDADDVTYPPKTALFRRTF